MIDGLQLIPWYLKDKDSAAKLEPHIIAADEFLLSSTNMAAMCTRRHMARQTAPGWWNYSILDLVLSSEPSKFRLTAS